MTGQNDREDESLTGQVRDQAGHCPLTGRYFQPWGGQGFEFKMTTKQIPLQGWHSLDKSLNFRG